MLLVGRRSAEVRLEVRVWLRELIKSKLFSFRAPVHDSESLCPKTGSLWLLSWSRRL